MKRTFFARIAVLCLFAVSMQAATIIGTFGAGYTNNTGGWTFVAQTFTVPVVDTTLTQWDFDIAGRSSAGDIAFSIREWNAGIIGATEYSALVGWSTSSGVISLGGLNVGLNAGQTYVAIYDLLGYGGSSIRWGSDAYAGGQGTWGTSLAQLESNAGGFASLDTSFEATFGGAIVPEPATFALVGLALAAFGVTRRARR